MGLTIAEKILAKASGKAKTHPGEIVDCKIDTVMINDITGPLAVDALEKLGVKRVWDSNRVVIVLDHQAPPTTIEGAKNHILLRKFARDQGIKNFYGVEAGICHQVLPEGGFAVPGGLVVGADSHTCTYGAFGTFATGIGSTDAAAVLATGKLWFRVPESMKISLSGKLPDKAMSKDLILKVIGDVGADGATYMAVEFGGEGVKEINISGRMTICNMGVEMGAKTAIVPPDKITDNYLSSRARWKYRSVHSDLDAEFKEKRDYELGEVEPLVACPSLVDLVKPVRAAAGVHIDQAFLGSCTNGRLEDLEVAAKVLKGKRVARETRMLVVPASREVYLKALRKGLLEIFVNAGAMVGSPSCAACMGGHIGILGPGEVCISSSNRNFRGRQGSPDAKIYLASPATVATSALKGEITDPRDI
jgi:3-isopropylmalate/(R)-2-methylmalate dehydratase large subunit